MCTKMCMGTGTRDGGGMGGGAPSGATTTRVYRYRDLWVVFPGFAFVDRRGYRGLELAGVTPDRVVTWTAEDLRMGWDPDVDEALAFLLDECGPPVGRPHHLDGTPASGGTD